MPDLPPDLDALGDALTRAAATVARARRRRATLRRRIAICVSAGLAVFAMTTPSPLGQAEHSSPVQLAAVAMSPIANHLGCDRPHGDSAALPDGCGPGEPQPQAAR